MRMTRPGTLAGIFAICAVAGWLATKATFTSMPLLPITAIPALAGLALAEAVVGRSVQNRISRRPGGRSPEPRRRDPGGQRRDSQPPGRRDAGGQFPDRRGTPRPIEPIAVARLVALAKASSAAASAIGGLVAGYLVFMLAEIDKSVPARDARVAGLTLAAALALVAAALYLEYCCRAPGPPDDDDDDDAARARDTWQWHG